MRLVVRSGQIRESDVAIASAVLAGKLNADAVVQAMVSNFLKGREKIERGHTKRPGSRLSDDLAAEFVLALGRGPEVKALCSRFFISATSLPGPDLNNPLLPRFYTAISQPNLLEQNLLVTLRHLAG